MDRRPPHPTEPTRHAGETDIETIGIPAWLTLFAAAVALTVTLHA